MRPTRRTQPYRSGAPRPAGQTLKAMLRGEPKYRSHPLKARRKLQRKRKRLRRPSARRV